MAERLLNTVLKDMNLVYKMTGKSGLKPSKLKGSRAAVHRLTAYFGTTKLQACLLTVAFFQTMKKPTVYIYDLGHYLEVDEDDLVCLLPDFNELIERGYVHYSLDPFGDNASFLNRTITFSQPLTACIMSDQPLAEMEQEPPMDIYRFVKEVASLLDFKSSTNGPSSVLNNSVKLLEKEHPHLDMPATLIKQSVCLEDRILFYSICDGVASHSYTALVQTLEEIYDNTKQRLLKTQALLNGSDALTQLGLIRIKSAQLLSNANLELTQKAMALFLGEDINLFFNETDRDYVKPEQITKKELFFDSEVSRSLQFLQNSLQHENYLKLQERMVELGMRGGIAVLMYGEPGTGKTESVFQLAKAVGRGIVHVSISETKSMWFGESEKKIKEVFDRYERICNRTLVKPILLFNEADAIFGKRKEVGTSNIDQTENAIQNIILEEMEKLEGILIATTNLTTNLDAAFERRFLFKILFSKPSFEVNQKIWKSKLDWLDNESLQRLATRYTFSGGEIDNVVRKLTIEEVLTGGQPHLERLMAFCESERLGKVRQRVAIGFRGGEYGG